MNSSRCFSWQLLFVRFYKVRFCIAVCVFAGSCFVVTNSVNAGERVVIIEKNQVEAEKAREKFIQKSISWHRFSEFVKTNKTSMVEFIPFESTYELNKSPNRWSEVEDSEGRRSNGIELVYGGTYTEIGQGKKKIEYSIVINNNLIAEQRWPSDLKFASSIEAVFYGLDNAKVLVSSKSNSVKTDSIKDAYLANCLFDYSPDEMLECVKWIRANKDLGNFSAPENQPDWIVLAHYFEFLNAHNDLELYRTVLNGAPKFLRECVVEIITSNSGLLSQDEYVKLILQSNFLKKIEVGDFAPVLGGIYHGIRVNQDQAKYSSLVKSFLERLQNEIMKVQTKEESVQGLERLNNIIKWAQANCSEWPDWQYGRN